MKKQSNLSRLLQIAGNHKYLTYASWVLSAISALIALVPFYYIWKVMQEVLAVAPDFSHAQNLTRNGWMAVLFAVIAVLVYIGALMCSHKGAFRIATNLRLQTMEHIVKLAPPPKPIWRISFPTVPMPLRRHAAFWFCYWCSTGGWDF